MKCRSKKNRKSENTTMRCYKRYCDGWCGTGRGNMLQYKRKRSKSLGLPPTTLEVIRQVVVLTLSLSVTVSSNTKQIL